MFRTKRGMVSRDKATPFGYVELLRNLTSNPEVAQSYDALLSSLRLSNSTSPLRTLIVTSTQPEEGKTTVAVSLALSMALAGKKPLLIDADLRRPRLDQVFRLAIEGGLADVFAGVSTLADVIHSVALDQEGGGEKLELGVVTSGRVAPNAFNTIESRKLRQAIGDLRERYDTVLLDSPPTLSVNDALLLAPVADGILLVLNTGVVSERDAKSAKDRIEQAGGRIIGVVMNRFDEKLHGPGYHPYHNYYRIP